MPPVAPRLHGHPQPCATCCASVQRGRQDAGYASIRSSDLPRDRPARDRTPGAAPRIVAATSVGGGREASSYAKSLAWPRRWCPAKQVLVLRGRELAALVPVSRFVCGAVGASAALVPERGLLRAASRARPSGEPGRTPGAAPSRGEPPARRDGALWASSYTKLIGTHPLPRCGKRSPRCRASPRADPRDPGERSRAPVVRLRGRGAVAVGAIAEERPRCPWGAPWRNRRGAVVWPKGARYSCRAPGGGRSSSGGARSARLLRPGRRVRRRAGTAEVTFTLRLSHI